MIEVFKTDINNKTTAKRIIKVLEEHFQVLNCNFDLTDCDKILRIESKKNITSQVVEMLTNKGFRCEVLEE